ncbi:hypothetical protein BDY19DRAFT_920276 [Irpex rosettiformis]|uniref:Uncharacterized protein n=1 Tax=Irpex rosettiformis TaxID=378272 RepID=A0ACB8UIA2_9APHY|nr:hypothetical protein BDY19DRAFT_920276 [Irpex rosettiformis]
MLDLLLCIPISFGCPTKIKPDTDADLTPRICPVCHNAAVQPAKARTWFELCFVPLVPMKSRRVWVCPICQWSMNIQPGWQPQVVGNYQPGPQDWLGMAPSGSYPQQYQPGYQPGYPPSPVNQHQKAQ